MAKSHNQISNKVPVSSSASSPASSAPAASAPPARRSTKLQSKSKSNNNNNRGYSATVAHRKLSDQFSQYSHHGSNSGRGTPVAPVEDYGYNGDVALTAGDPITPISTNNPPYLSANIDDEKMSRMMKKFMIVPPNIDDTVQANNIIEESNRIEFGYDENQKENKYNGDHEKNTVKNARTKKPYRGKGKELQQQLQPTIMEQNEDQAVEAHTPSHRKRKAEHIKTPNAKSSKMAQQARSDFSEEDDFAIISKSSFSEAKENSNILAEFDSKATFSFIQPNDGHRTPVHESQYLDTTNQRHWLESLGTYEPVPSNLLAKKTTAEQLNVFFRAVDCDDPKLKQISSLSMDEWSLAGQELLEREKLLIEKAVAARTKLISRFGVITTVINNHAAAFEEHDVALSTKAKQIGGYGQEITNIK